jgi:hypothetical protein
MLRLLLALSLSTIMVCASAAQILPAQPYAFQVVNLRMTVDSCTFNPKSVRVTASANTIRVTQLPNACLLPGEARLVDVKLGAFPIGNYSVEVFASADSTATPIDRLGFQVVALADMVSPPLTLPLTDYTGVWWTPSESGWGLFLYQSPVSHWMFGAWFVYDTDGRPAWLTLQDGHWTSYSTWTANVYRTSGPWLGAAFDPRLFTIQRVGEATIDFTQVPANDGRAILRYDVSGVGAGTKTIQRFGASF